MLLADEARFRFKQGLFQSIGLYSIFGKKLVEHLWLLWELVLTGGPTLVVGSSVGASSAAILGMVSETDRQTDRQTSLCRPLLGYWTTGLYPVLKGSITLVWSAAFFYSEHAGVAEIGGWLLLRSVLSTSICLVYSQPSVHLSLP